MSENRNRSTGLFQFGIRSLLVLALVMATTCAVGVVIGWGELGRAMLWFPGFVAFLIFFVWWLRSMHRLPSGKVIRKMLSPTKLLIYWLLFLLFWVAISPIGTLRHLRI